jgi:hypothetical protein
MKTNNLWVASRVALLALVAVSGVLVGCRGELGSIERDLGQPDRVRIESRSVSVRASRATGNARFLAELDSRRRVTVDEQGSRVTVRLSRLQSFVNTKDERIELLVPDGTTLEIDSGSGSVEIDGISLSALNVDVGSGSVTISTVDGPVRANTGSGSITLSDVTGDIRAEAGSGSIGLSNVMGRIDVQTGSGSVDGEMVRLTGDSSFDTGSGSIEVAFENREDELSFDLEAGSGSITVGQTSGADRIKYGSGSIEVTGESGSGAQTYRTR